MQSAVRRTQHREIGNEVGKSLVAAATAGQNELARARALGGLALLAMMLSSFEPAADEYGQSDSRCAPP